MSQVTGSSNVSPPNEGMNAIASVVLLFILLTILGSLGFMIIEDWGFQKALFFTLITITTVGYGDEGISEAGKMYAVLVILCGFSVTTYTFSLLMQQAVASRITGGFRVQSKIDALKGHSIVCGYGRMGQTICDQLARDHAAFVVVECDQDCYELAIRNHFLAIRGSASDDEVLLRAGIERATHIVSAVDGEVENIAVALSASELNPDIDIIARAERDTEVRKLKRAGASRTVSPFRAGGVDVANAILRPDIADVLLRSNEDDCPLELLQILIHPGSELDGMSLSHYGQNDGVDVAFVALQRVGCDLVISPMGDTVLEPGDTVMVAGRPEDIARMNDAAHASTIDS